MNKTNDNLSSPAKEKVKRSASQTIIPRILSILGAIALWFYVVSVESYTFDKTFINIPISLKGVEQMSSHGLSVISGYDITAEITVSGKKSDVNKLKASDLSAYIDLSSITQSGTHELTIYCSTESSVQVTNCYPNNATVYVDKTSTKTVPVKVSTQYIIGSGLLMDNPDEPGIPSIEVITVTGPAEILNRIKYAEAKVNLGNVTESVTASADLVLVDEHMQPLSNPYLKLSANRISVTYTVTGTQTVPDGTGEN